MNKWKSVWERKNIEKLSLDKSEFEIFCELKKADGFDVNVGNEEKYYRSFYKAWEEMYLRLNSFTGNSIRSVYEVGCGSGVNLFLFQNRIGKEAKLGGIDYSSNLIDIAKGIIYDNDLTCDEAKNIEETEKYDLVMADSVFQYFDGIDYAETVLRKMLSKADKIVYLGELHDSNLESEWLENRRKAMENYDVIYSGLPKMFYSRDWVEDIAKEYGRKVFFTVADNEEYWNSSYLFNCYIF